MTMHVGVVIFPGSNCDVDVFHVCQETLGVPVKYLRHGEKSVGEVDLVVLPGGFSYGDYLRPGAIAGYAPVMEAVEEHARREGLVLGICNGFQVLTEVDMLPGALYRNLSLQFRCVYTHVRVEGRRTPFTANLAADKLLRLPVANGDGNYYADRSTLQEMEENGQIIFRYTDHEGRLAPEANPSGSMDNIAGVCNLEGNVLGMMPHPERASHVLLGGEDGLEIFRSLLYYGEKYGV